jgi:leucine-rich repeat-containing G protein-coupled receptor 6
MDVPRLLICNLAVADFCMGIYLGFLAVVDASTLGKYNLFHIIHINAAGLRQTQQLGDIQMRVIFLHLGICTCFFRKRRPRN